MEAVDRYGVARSGLMALWRVLRCHPFVRGGYDPVVQPVTHSTSTVSPESASLAPPATDKRNY